ncbi:substrate-binding periplasmic protein [Marinobacterium lutimaris]|uniref:Amino acid ABC transporter substrate-binding protein, PAAT family n=1 Tax=Marinobacterium lutimaris TaxID=568106 RepID=A0A1H6DQT9_9GAMM|nr:ABC transporter substrate-binding protein [Marinobacterium lutimaris]SEG87043.1 amino acid ABC transporter substrate-binding protein, PAAT family [Marinobacterium lutimaris]
MSLKNRLSICALSLAIGLASTTTSADELDVGVTTTGIPFTFVDTQTQEPTGAMVDLAKAIAAKTGDTVSFEITAFSALIPALKTGKIDMISAGMFATEKRAEIVDFSDVVYSYGDAMFVASDDDTPYTIDDLDGEVVGAQVGTTFADALQARGTFKEVKLYDALPDIMRDVKLGRLKAGFGDKPIIAYQIGQNPGLGVRMVGTYEAAKQSPLALAVSKDNPELLARVNKAIAEMKSSGELFDIFAKYGL